MQNHMHDHVVGGMKTLIVKKIKNDFSVTERLLSTLTVTNNFFFSFPFLLGSFCFAFLLFLQINDLLSNVWELCLSFLRELSISSLDEYFVYRSSPFRRHCFTMISMTCNNALTLYDIFGRATCHGSSDL